MKLLLPCNLRIGFWLLALHCAITSSSYAWWDKSYPIRQPLTISTTAEGVAIPGTAGDQAVLVRLHEGNFNFLAASDNGADMRFLAEDDETLLPFHVEKFDSLLNEAYVWVRVPNIEPDVERQIWLYYGNPAGTVGGNDPAGTFGDTKMLVYHFGDRGGIPADSTKNGNNATNGGITVEGGIIGSAVRLDGNTSITIPTSDTLTWEAGGELTWSAWVKAFGGEGPQAIFHYANDGDALVIGIENMVPFIDLRTEAAARSASEVPLNEGTWHHLALVSSGGQLELYVDGKSHSQITGSLPAPAEALGLGGPIEDVEGLGRFNGELDELRIASVASTPAMLAFANINQGPTQDASRLVFLGEMGGGHGGHNEALEHMMLFGDIAANMMFDGWIAVGVCIVMIIFGWAVAYQKFTYLNSIQKGTDAFMNEWKKLSNDLTALDHSDSESVNTFGGKVDKGLLKHIRRSPLYHLYHIGSEEIRHRIGNDRSKGLGARSMQAIRAALETGLVRENQKMNKGIVFLTISIAGGPYVGLLGTVVGVMITFAIIAKSGEVDVNSIAPGIASALLATTAGLVVAIPALFMYSYLATRIKDVLAAMQVFIDEFIAKMAEFYPPASELGLQPAMATNQFSHSSANPINKTPVLGNPLVTGDAIGIKPLPRVNPRQAAAQREAEARLSQEDPKED